MSNRDYWLKQAIFYQDTQEYHLAIQAYENALKLEPEAPSAELLGNMGVVCQFANQKEKALQYYRQALKLKPDLALLHSNLAALLLENYQIKEAFFHAQQAIQLDKNSTKGYLVLGKAHHLCGQVEETLICYTKALELEPNSLTIFSMLLFCLFSTPDLAESRLFGYLRQYNRLCTASLTQPSSFKQQLKPQKRLKLGYVSADFCRHSTAKMLMILLKHHRTDEFEIYAYSDTQQPDDWTSEFQKLVHHWRETAKQDDVTLGQQILADEIDILIDWCGHTSNNRLKLFAQHLAPLQVTGLGFGCTTGLKAMDYLFIDPFVRPPKLARFSSEKLLYLSSLMHWEPPDFELPTSASPVLTKGYTTFGCGNNLFKLNQAVIALWSEILVALPSAKLHLKTSALEDIYTQELLRQGFESHGVKPEQLLFSGRSHFREHLLFYREIDIALDPFPYDGGVTTCETLWMGVPVIALNTGCRMGANILQVMELQELLAETKADYKQIALDLAQQTTRLKDYHLNLRARLLTSPICAGKNYAREVERAYRAIWYKKCSESEELLFKS